MGFAQVDPATGQEIVLAMLEQIAEDGMLSHMISPVDRSEITQPPVLAWSAKTIFERTKDTAWLKTCVPYLRRYLEWMRLNRDKNGNGIPEWHISGHPLCRSGESGLDNSSRFDRAVLLDAPDFGSFLCHDYACLSELAAAVGEAELSRTCRGHSERIGRAVHDVLWSQRDGLFMDRTFDGPFIEVKAVSGFLPLLAGIADDAQVNRLREHLLNPRTFGTALPLPSIAVDEGTYTKDMWRGPTWINTNYAICCGLRRYGFGEDAQRLKESSLSAIERWYGEEGCLFEFYDSLDITSPRKLDRKQRLSQGTGMAPISDYHWTAALVAAWLMEEGEEEVVE